MNRPIFDELLEQGLLNEVRKRKILTLSLLYFTADCTCNTRSLHLDDLHRYSGPKLRESFIEKVERGRKGLQRRKELQFEEIVDQSTRTKMN